MLKGKGVWAFVLEARMKFQIKAVNMLKTITITKAIDIIVTFHIVTGRTASILKLGKRKKF